MSDKIEMGYKVTFFPTSFRVQQNFTTQGNIPYWEVVNDKGEIICTSHDENAAKFICLSMELVISYIRGDGSASRDIMNQLQKMRGN